MGIIKNKDALLSSATDPASGAENDIYFNTATKRLRVYTSGTWVDVFGSNATGNRTVSASDPTGGSDGDVWFKI